MGTPGRTTATIISSLILVFGLIHLGVGIGLVVKNHQYNDIFRQPTGLSGFNIVIGLYGIAVGILSLFVVLGQRGGLSTKIAIVCGVLGIFAGASLITALVLNTQAISFIRNRLAYRMALFVEDQQSQTILNAIQTNYQCCGRNLWLDWANYQLGTNVVTGTSTGTGRRRRDLSLQSSPLTRIVQRRQTTGSSTGNTYGFPNGYTVTLPASCCTGGSTTASNSLAATCNFDSTNGTNSFYTEGCLGAVSNVAVSQITGIVVINTCLAILAFVFVPILIRLFPAAFDPNNPNTKQPLPNDMFQGQQQQQQQQQQNQYEGYYTNNIDSNAYYGYPAPTYVVYQQ